MAKIMRVLGEFDRLGLPLAKQMQSDHPLSAGDQAGEGAQQRRLARAVAAGDHHRPTTRQLERKVSQDGASAAIDGKPLDTQAVLFLHAHARRATELCRGIGFVFP